MKTASATQLLNFASGMLPGLSLLQSAIRNHRSAIATLLCVASLASVASAHLAPDLTNGTTRFTIDTTYNYNLGPTGLRGWIYIINGIPGGEYGMQTSEEPWQILVTSVGTGTPALTAGLKTNDVILGAKAGGGTVPLFTNDARKSMGWAIGDAEATNGILRLLVNRYGVGTNQTYSIQLKMSNLAYSATAPYNCPKSARVLADAATVISNRAFNLGIPGDPVLGLAKMAVGITNGAGVRTYALSICATNGQYSLSRQIPGDAWTFGYQNVFLSEYYLFTGDTSVTTGVRELAIALAKGQSKYGT
jgi:hypothetical protein